jgi:energy-coupling factor transporter ATP-binding protein EcfA2
VHKDWQPYVPGLAGVPLSEQYRTESVVRRGVASGDANLYLRNVLWLIKEKGLIAELEAAMRNLFPKFVMWLEFDSKLDVYINVEVSVTGNSGRRCPLELVGTGVLQSLQIFSYVTLFAPMLLLLDEPDSHLHPDNQVLLAHALEYIASNTSTVVILSTHSRHLVDALQDDSNFAWLKDGKVYQQGQGIDKLPLLMDLGALDSFDRLLAGTIKYVFLTEDTDMAMLKMIAKHIGLKENEVLFFSYKTSSNLEPAKILARFIKDITPNTEVYIHRDRDFMTDSEVSVIKGKISSSGATPFITDGCDLESYFLEPDHLALLLNVDNNMVEDWLNTIAQSNHAQLQHSFTRKRDDIKKLLYRDSPETCPNTLALIGNDIPLPSQLRHGKELLKKARKEMHSHFSKTIDPIQISTALDIPSDLVSLAITL